MKTAEKNYNNTFDHLVSHLGSFLWDLQFEKQNLIILSTSPSQILISSRQDTFAICETRPHLCHRHNARNVEGRHQSGDPAHFALCTCAVCSVLSALYSFTVLCTVCSYTVLYLFSSALFCLGHSSLVFDTWGLDAMIGGQSQIQR